MATSRVSALLERAQSGDLRAFEELVQPHVGRIYSYVARMVGDPVEAEDLAQEVVLRAHRAINSFRGGATFQTWLYRIATNITVDAIRRRKRQECRVCSLDDPLPGTEGTIAREVPDNQLTPDALVERAELRREVGDAIQELSPKLRAVVVLFDLEGCSYEEIAVALGLPLGTVKSRLFNARARLRDRLKSYVEGYA